MCLCRYTGTNPNPPPGSHYTSPSENMWNTGGAYSMSQGMSVSGKTHTHTHHLTVPTALFQKHEKEKFYVGQFYNPDHNLQAFILISPFVLSLIFFPPQECQQLTISALSLVAVALQFLTTTSSPLVQTRMHVRKCTHTAYTPTNTETHTLVSWIAEVSP